MKRPILIAMPLGLALAGCVNLKTPEKPIEINLNVAIRQEVLVRMQRDVDTLIDQNPQAFPQRPVSPAPAPAKPQ
ncbi:YnbE family lipoprotein [Sphingomonas humi]|uniref:YnbE-like lipoprotein n=1 Tax=Sphingomonas humi TaxID=335630 RepID=A0ABP7S7Y0_9SPHN